MTLASEELFTVYRMGDSFLIKVAGDPVEYFSGGKTQGDLAQAIHAIFAKQAAAIEPRTLGE